MGNEMIAKDSRAFLEAIEKSKMLSSKQRRNPLVPKRPAAKPHRKARRK
jgi:hypothetical protein